ncbi:MAG: hypothetical protein ABIQ64_04690 [Candidatus Saccharimonadales bacterium]
MKRHLAAIGAITAISAAGLTGVSVVNAATTTDSAHPMSSLVDAIASKFNLDKSQVQSVFDEQRTAMQEDREAEIKTQVSQLVKDGKITQAQADKINAKRTELQKERETNRETMQGKTSDERKAAMQAHKTELDKWFSDNGIDSQYRYLLMGGHGHGARGGFGGHGMHRDQNDSTDNSSQTQ